VTSEDYLITEYKEIGEFVRARERINWEVAAIFIPLSFGIFSLLLGLQPDAQVKLIGPLAITSLSLYVIFALFWERMSDYNQTSYVRLRAIESELKELRIHHEIDQADTGLKRRIVRVRHLVRFPFFILLGLWTSQIGHNWFWVCLALVYPFAFVLKAAAADP
jgi:hypothetical protein